MRCKNIECLIIDSSEKELSPREKLSIEKHTLDCEACSHFQDDWEKIRLSSKKIRIPVLPAELEKKTRLICQAETSANLKKQKRFSPHLRSGAVSKPLWAALIILIGLTMIFLFPLAKDFRLDQTMSFQTVIALTLILQNAAMLIFSPIVIRKYRSQNHDLKPL